MKDQGSIAGEEISESRRIHLSKIAEELTSAPELDDPRWEEIAVVFSLSNGGHNFGNGGYAYGNNGDWWALSFPVPTVKPLILAYLHDFQIDLPDTLIQVLFQYNRQNGFIRVDQSLDLPGRWLITLENARDMIVQLKPNLA